MTFEAALKEIKNIRSVEHIFENAEKLCDQFVIDSRTESLLYENCRCKPVSRVAWAREIRAATSIDRIMHAHFAGSPLPYKLGKFEDLIDPIAMSIVSEQLKSSQPTLLLSFHGCFIILARVIFNYFVATLKGGKTLGRGGTIGSKDPREALFSAVRTLQSGETLLMSPDGPDGKGKRSVTLNVLGKSSPISDGAAFLAYTTNCNTAWYTAIRVGNRFVPVFELGPRRENGEPFSEFRNRLYRFYANKIETVFTGDPRNINLRGDWTRVFNQNDSHKSG